MSEFKVQPYAKSGPEDKITNPFGLNYVNQEYWGFKNRMLEFIKQKYSREFNDFTESSLVIMILEAAAFLADTLSFKVDQVFNELSISSVTEIENAFKLAKFVGFKPTPPIPAKAMFVGTLNSVLNQDLRIKTPVKLNFEIPGYGGRMIELFHADAHGNPIFGEDIIVPAGSLSITSVVGIEGTSQSYKVESNGELYQIIRIPGNNILLNSINIIVNDTVWEEVDYFTEFGNFYTVENDANYNATIMLGDSIPKGSVINIFYRQGGGNVGNIISGGVENIVRVTVPGYSHAIIVNFKNYTKGEYGYDGDGIEEIRRKLPIYLRTQNRAVTSQDYKAIAELYSSSYHGSVGKAMAALRNHGCAGNIVDLYILANSGNGTLTKPDANLIEKLALEIDKKKMLTDYVCVRSGEIVTVDISIEIILSSIQRKNELNIKDKVFRRIQMFFALANWDFGKTLKESEIIKVLNDIKEIENIDVTFTTVKGLESGEGHQNIVDVNFNEIIQLDTLLVNFNYK